ncbi:hypothetical protein RLDS_05725 [Sphingobium lactosutens DS20]|uniref:Uncharacterized protein n=1 Tax=Sphingobium lactosutens DS20 TaxID=1331060 RepID=T0HXX5_9SPHN|nr:hypothetical protein RLDS_05725 [Sphingobium lactosutens DS20]
MSDSGFTVERVCGGAHRQRVIATTKTQFRIMPDKSPKQLAKALASAHF